MNVDQASNAARAFHLAAERCLEERKVGQGKVQILMVPAIVCQAFSVELALKALLLRNGKRARGHNLGQLFDELDSDTKARVEATTNQNAPPFNQALFEASGAFEQWRYIYEQSTAQASPNFLTSFANAILQEMD